MRAFEFIMENIRTIGVVYLIIAAIVFTVVFTFFVYVAKEEDKEREMYQDREFYDPDRDGNGMSQTLLFDFIVAAGCAILWVEIPLLLIGLWAYMTLTKKFQDLSGGLEDEMEEFDKDESEE